MKCKSIHGSFCTSASLMHTHFCSFQYTIIYYVNNFYQLLMRRQSSRCNDDRITRISMRPIHRLHQVWEYALSNDRNVQAETQVPSQTVTCHYCSCFWLYRLKQNTEWNHHLTTAFVFHSSGWNRHLVNHHVTTTLILDRSHWNTKTEPNDHIIIFDHSGWNTNTNWAITCHYYSFFDRFCYVFKRPLFCAWHRWRPQENR